MSFLNTVFLAALAAAAIPILLHLLSRQRLPVIPFSTLEFLKRLQKRQARTVNLRQWLLLAIRTLAVIALVLIFARPAIRSIGAAGSVASTEMAVIVDDGVSATAETRDGAVNHLEMAVIGQIAAALSPGDLMTVIPAAHPERAIRIGAGESEIVRKLNQEIPSSFAPLKLYDALVHADSALTAGGRFNRELYLVSPFYDPHFDSLTMQSETAHFRRYLVPVGPNILDNAGITELKRHSNIIQRGQPVEFEATVRNWGERDLSDAPVGIYLDGGRVGQMSVSIPAGGAATLAATITPQRSGKLGGWIRLEEPDPLAADDRRYFILDVPDSISVLAVDPDPAERAILSALFSSDRTGYIHLNWGDPTGWETASLAGYDVLLLAGSKSVSGDSAKRVRDFAARGGGVILFPGAESDLSALGRGLWKELGFSPARGVIRESNVTWGKVDLGHPLFAGIFEEGGAPRSPAFNLCLDLTVAAGDQVIIPLSDGRPFLMERPVDRGRAMMFAAPLGSNGGSFSIAGIFAPLLLRSVSYAASESDESDREWNLGSSTDIVVPLARAESARLIMPDSSGVELPPRPVVGGVEYHIPDVPLAGIYSLSTGGSVKERYAANIPGNVSRLHRADLTALAKRLRAEELSPDSEKMTAAILSARYGQELWKPIAAILLLLLVAESVLGRGSESDKVIRKEIQL